MLGKEQTKQTKPDPTRPDQTRPNHTKPNRWVGREKRMIPHPPMVPLQASKRMALLLFLPRHFQPSIPPSRSLALSLSLLPLLTPSFFPRDQYPSILTLPLNPCPSSYIHPTIVSLAPLQITSTKQREKKNLTSAFLFPNTLPSGVAPLPLTLPPPPAAAAAAARLPVASR